MFVFYDDFNMRSVAIGIDKIHFTFLAILKAQPFRDVGEAVTNLMIQGMNRRRKRIGGNSASIVNYFKDECIFITQIPVDNYFSFIISIAF